MLLFRNQVLDHSLSIRLHLGLTLEEFLFACQYILAVYLDHTFGAGCLEASGVVEKSQGGIEILIDIFQAIQDGEGKVIFQFERVCLVGGGFLALFETRYRDVVAFHNI